MPARMSFSARDAIRDEMTVRSLVWWGGSELMIVPAIAWFISSLSPTPSDDENVSQSSSAARTCSLRVSANMLSFSR